MWDFIKLLLEQPNKLRSTILAMANAILVILLSSYLYKSIVGPYTLIELSDYKAWTEFLLSGRALMCGLICVTCYILLFQILPMFTMLPFNWIGKRSRKSFKMDHYDHNMLRWVFKYFELLNIDVKTKQIKLMDNSDALYSFALAINEKDSKAEMNNFRQSFLNDIGNTYLCFTIIFFSILPEWSGNPYLKTIVLIGLALIVIIYSGISIMLEIISKISGELLYLIQKAKYQSQVEETFKYAGLVVHHPEEKSKIYDVLFDFEKRKFGIKYLYPKNIIINQHFIRKFKERCKEIDITGIAICNNFEIDLPSQEKLRKKNESMIFVFVANDSELKKELNHLIISSFSNQN